MSRDLAHTRERQEWQPDWTVAPGETLREVLDESGMSPSELAERMGRPLSVVHSILSGQGVIDRVTAKQLEAIFGISARVWSNLEDRFRSDLVRLREMAESEKACHERE